MNGRIEEYYDRTREDVNADLSEHYTAIESELVATVEEYDSLLALQREQRVVAIVEHYSKVDEELD